MVAAFDFAVVMKANYIDPDDERHDHFFTIDSICNQGLPFSTVILEFIQVVVSDDLCISNRTP